MCFFWYIYCHGKVRQLVTISETDLPTGPLSIPPVPPLSTSPSSNTIVAHTVDSDSDEVLEVSSFLDQSAAVDRSGPSEGNRSRPNIDVDLHRTMEDLQIDEPRVS